MAAPRWIFVAFLLTLSLELCYSRRPLTIDGAMNKETIKDEAHNNDTMSNNVIIKDGAVMGGPECVDNNCGGCNHPGCVIIPPPVIVPTPCEPPYDFEPLPPIDNEPCLPPIPPIIVVPPIDVEPWMPPLPPIIVEPPCLPPVPPIIVEPPFNCAECPHCDVCVNYSKMDAAMAPAPAS